jgi:hypothetical protein
MDDISEKTAQQASESDEEIIDLVEEVSDTTAEDDEEIIELTEAVEEAPSEAVAPPAEEQEEGPDLGVEYEDAGATDLLAELGMEVEAESQEARVDREMIESQFSKEELEALVTRAAKDAISEIAERIVTEEAEKAILKEIERIKSALK